jgi:hypothetical protein
LNFVIAEGTHEQTLTCDYVSRNFSNVKHFSFIFALRSITHMRSRTQPVSSFPLHHYTTAAVSILMGFHKLTRYHLIKTRPLSTAVSCLLHRGDTIRQQRKKLFKKHPLSVPIRCSVTTFTAQTHDPNYVSSVLTHLFLSLRRMKHVTALRISGYIN